MGGAEWIAEWIRLNGIYKIRMKDVEMTHRPVGDREGGHAMIQRFNDTGQ